MSLLAAALWIGACSAPSGGDADPDLERFRELAAGKNLVMILLDAAAYRHFGFAGYERNTTPVIDGLAAEGLVFDNAYSPSASTGHTVFSMLTSSYPFLAEREGLKGRHSGAFAVTDSTHLMAELLAGRFERRVGITSNNWFGPEFGFARGFTHFYETYNKSAVPDSTKRRAGRTLDLFRQDLAEWGDGQNFAYLHFLEPHSPYSPPERFARMFDPVAADSVDGGSRALLNYRLDPPDARRQDWIRALYDGNLAYADSMVGEVVDALKADGRWEDTVVLLIADHGEAFWQHGVSGHGRHVYDEFVRIPFVLRFPGASELAGRHVAANVSLIDLLPTYLDLFDLPQPPGLRGRTLLPLLAGREEAFEGRELYLRNTHSDVPEFGLRMGRHKWIYKVYRGSYECYDLLSDPLEQNDLVAAGRVPPEITGQHERIALWIATGTERVEPIEELDEKTREQLKAIGYF